MYIRDQNKPSGISLGLGWLEDLAKSPDEGKARMLKDDMIKQASGVKDGKGSAIHIKGVEHYYQEWLEVRAGEDWEVYYLAAQAARQLGCGAACYLRLMKALGASPPPEQAQTFTSEKQDMERGWAHVDIRLRRKAKGDLQPVGGLPFASDQARAIIRAQIDLRQKGKFDGLLPAVPYIIDGQPIPLGPDYTIASGVSVVNIDQKGDGSFQLKSKPGAWNYVRAGDECPCRDEYRPTLCPPKGSL